MNIYNRLMDLDIFILHKTEKGDIGYWIEYKYYPKYMVDKHYTLVIFKYWKYKHSDFRLYIHNNVNGSYCDSLFQISDDSEWGIKYLNEQINTIFKIELRKIKLKNISS